MQHGMRRGGGWERHATRHVPATQVRVFWGVRPHQPVPCPYRMTFEDPTGYTFWIDEREIVDVYHDEQHWVIVASWGDLYDLSDDENPRHICTIVDERQRLLHLGLTK